LISLEEIHPELEHINTIMRSSKENSLPMEMVVITTALDLEQDSLISDKIFNLKALCKLITISYKL